LDKPDVIQGTALRGMFHVWINEGGYESNDTKEISEKRYHLYRGFVKKEITLENAVNEIRENPLD